MSGVTFTSFEGARDIIAIFRAKLPLHSQKTSLPGLYHGNIKFKFPSLFSPNSAVLLESIIIRLLKGTENHVENITVIQQKNGRKNNICALGIFKCLQRRN